MSATTMRKETRAQARWELAGALAIAALLVAALIVVSRAGHHTAGTRSGGALSQVGAVNARFAGIPEQGISLGDPKAPVTLVEFGDLQCPFCAQFARGTLPALVTRYVRAGRLRIEFRNLAFLGPDSVRAARVAAGAADQNRLWPFIDLFYANQGEENTGYVTDSFLRRVGGAVRGLDSGRALRAGTGSAATAALAQAQALAQRYGVSSTPSFLLGRTGGTLQRLDVSSPSPGAFAGPIERLAA